MKAMRVVVSLGECCSPSSRTLPLNASPRQRRPAGLRRRLLHLHLRLRRPLHQRWPWRSAVDLELSLSMLLMTDETVWEQIPPELGSPYPP